MLKAVLRVVAGRRRETWRRVEKGKASGPPVMASLQGLPLQHKLQGLPEPGGGATNGERAQGNTQGQRARDQGQETSAGERPREGLCVQFQGGREVSHGPAGAYLSRAASPDLERNARMEPVEDDLGRSNVAFARYGFAERAQNGQRVGVRSPVGAPDDWGVGDVLTKKSSQVGAVTL